MSPSPGPEVQSGSRHQERRRFQYSLRAMLGGVLLVSVGMTAWKNLNYIIENFFLPSILLIYVLLVVWRAQRQYRTVLPYVLDLAALTAVFLLIAPVVWVGCALFDNLSRSVFWDGAIGDDIFYWLCVGCLIAPVGLLLYHVYECVVRRSAKSARICTVMLSVGSLLGSVVYVMTMGLREGGIVLYAFAIMQAAFWEMSLADTIVRRLSVRFEE